MTHVFMSILFRVVWDSADTSTKGQAECAKMLDSCIHLFVFSICGNVDLSPLFGEKSMHIAAL